MPDQDSQFQGLQTRLEPARRIDAASIAQEYLNKRITGLKNPVKDSRGQIKIDGNLGPGIKIFLG